MNHKEIVELIDYLERYRAALESLASDSAFAQAIKCIHELQIENARLRENLGTAVKLLPKDMRKIWEETS